MIKPWHKLEKLKFTLPEFEIALHAAVKGGEEIIRVYSSDFSSKMKDDDSPITIADLKSNKVIKEILSKTGYAILSEEDRDDKKRLEEKKPILGVIYWPTENTIFAAQKGCGAWKFSNDLWEKIMVSKTLNLNQCMAIGSRHHMSDNEKNLLKKLQITKFTSVGSSLKVAKISSGSADVYLTITNKMKEWDTCASYCIVSEAGGKMTDMLGNDLSYNNQNVTHLNGILATNGLIHNKIVEYQKSQ